ncbi:lectin-like domain-containing protein, partial [Staphylococcus pseudintermedius]
MEKNRKSKRLDFLPNKLNKYSIRKFTVGTASILIGSLLYLGIGNEAQASETTTKPATEETQASETTTKPATEETQASETTTKSATEETQASETTTKPATEETQASETTTKPATEETQASETTTKPATEEAQASETTTKPATEETQASETTANPATEEARVSETTTKPATEETQASETTANPATEEARVSETIANPTIKKDQVTETAQKPLKQEASTSVTVPKPKIRKVRSVSSVNNIVNKPSQISVSGKDAFNFIGSVDVQKNPSDLNVSEVVRFNEIDKGNSRARIGAIQFKNKIGFNNDFDFNIRIANAHQSNTTGADGWGFLFTKDEASEYMKKGGILGPKGIENSAGFKIDTGYNYTDPMDKEEKQAGQGYRGYGTFVKNDASGKTSKVGSNIPEKGKPDNFLNYADNNINKFDGKFHGQDLNYIRLMYDSSSEKLKATYANKVWEANLSDLNLNKNELYNFLITSSQRFYVSEYDQIHASGWMRTDLNGSIFKYTPNVVTDLEKRTEEIPFGKERHFNPNLKPGEEKVTQQGEPGEKTITTPIT